MAFVIVVVVVAIVPVGGGSVAIVIVVVAVLRGGSGGQGIIKWNDVHFCSCVSVYRVLRVPVKSV